MSKCLLLRPWQLRHTTVRSSTAPHGDRSQPPRPVRERSASSTTAYGHRSDFSWRCGQHRCRRCCRRWGCSGTPWSRGSCTRLTCRSSTLLCRRKVDQLVDFFKNLDIEVPAQVIEVPKIFQDIVPQRSVDLVPQLVEQLVEVPTVLTPTRIAVQIAEQIVGIPVPHGRGQGSLPGQGSPASGKRTSERIVEQIVDFPVQTVEQLVDTSLGNDCGLGSSSSAGPADEGFLLGFCALFPIEKSAECRAGGECAAGWARQLIHAERSSNASCRRARGQR